MANIPKSHPLIDSYLNYAYEATTKRRPKGNGNRYINNPFILRFAILLDYVLSGVLIEKNSSSNGDEQSKYIELVATDPTAITGLTPDMYVIRGRTNKKIVCDFLQFNAVGDTRFQTQEEIGDYIYLTHQKKRKYRSDCTLEEIIDFMNFTGDSIGSILLRSNGLGRTSFVHYIRPADIPSLDKMALLKDTTFPAFAIPAYGIVVCVRVSKKRGITPSATDSQSNNAFTFLCSDPLGAVKSTYMERFNHEFSRTSIKTIQEEYRSLIDLFAQDSMDSPLWDNSANGTRYVFGGIDDLRLLKESGWYKELLIYNDERQQADMAIRSEDMQIAAQKAREARLRQQSTKRSLSDILGSL